MTTTTERVTDRVSIRAGFGHAMVIMRRNLLRTVRIPQLLVFATIQPIMFLLLFNFVFGGALTNSLPPAAQGSYINWLIPGLLIQVATFGSSQTAIGLAEDLKGGVIDRFKSLPIARSAVLAGRTSADLIRNGLVMSIMLVVGYLIGFRASTSFAGVLFGLVIALLWSYALSWVMAGIGLLVKDPEATQSAVFLPMFVLVFASSVFVPVQTLPTWLQGFARNQPITAMANALRGLMLGEGALPPGTTVQSAVALALAWVVVITAIAAPLAVRLYRRTSS